MVADGTCLREEDIARKTDRWGSAAAVAHVPNVEAARQQLNHFDLEARGATSQC